MWAIFAIGAYLLLAVNGVADKFLLTKSVRHPIAYAFYVGITGPLTLLLLVIGLIGQWLNWNFLQAEFVFQWLSFNQALVALIGGICFPLALYFSYKAISQVSVSRILPIQGGLVPIFTLLLAYIILHERLTGIQVSAFIFLVLGAVMISFKKEHGDWHTTALKDALISSFLFAMSLTLQKYVFGRANFASGLIWTRMGFFVFALSLLAFKQSRTYIFNTPGEVSTGSKFVYLAARISGGVSGFMQNYAINIGSVTLVNAMQGTQYAFLLGLTSLLSLKFPKILKEKINAKIIIQKVIAIVLISAGLLLFVF